MNQQPIWVLNPGTDTMINVQPLFWILEAMGFDGAFDVIDEAIRTILVYGNPDFPIEPNCDLFVNIYQIRQAFKDLHNGQTILPEPKNKK